MPRRVPGAKRIQAEAEPGVSHVLKDQQVMTLLGVKLDRLALPDAQAGLTVANLDTVPERQRSVTVHQDCLFLHRWV